MAKHIGRIGLALLLLTLFAGAALADYSMPVADDNLSVTQGLDESWLNLLLIGTDTRQDDLDSGRSDTMIICSINQQTGALKLTSLARDMWVEIGDKGHMNKLNAAHSFGGPNLLMQTINRQFGMNIEHYVTINFEGIVDIVDILGGVTVELAEDEISTINGSVGRQIPALERGAGERTLCGEQALAYVRIRKLDNDFERTNRQRKLLEGALSKVRECSVTELLSLVTTGLGYVKTNLSIPEIMSIGINVLENGVNRMDTKGLPAEGQYRYDSSDGVSKLIVDTQELTDSLHGFIYGN